jgi:uncharacterized protein (DUF58 family)
MNKAEIRILILPGRLLFVISLFYLLLGCTAFFFETLFLVWVLTGAGLVPFLVTDLLFLILLGSRLQVKRIVPSSIAQGESFQVKLIINTGDRFLFNSHVRLFDLYPDIMSSNVFPVKLNKKTLKETGKVIFEYNVMPNERGSWYFTGTEFLLGSLLKFWQMRVTHNVINKGRTYPNFKQMAQGQKLKGKVEKGSIRKIRKRGLGMEFESLRDYQDGDSVRLIDWRATSRNRRLDGSYKFIIKNYMEEQDQQVLLIIDSGYRLPDFQFDSALYAMLMLSYTALKHGDAVAAASFGAADLWIPPRKGMHAYTCLMNSLYALHSEPVPSSPFSALENALGRLHRRSFIILISNFREEDDKTLSWILPRIERRHLLLLVSFHESEAEKLAFPEINLQNADRRSNDEILHTAAAFAYLANRSRLYRKWEHSGLLVLETSPEHISSALINKYLYVKRTGKL